MKVNGDVTYEAFALKEMGYYASPERQSNLPGAINQTMADAPGGGGYYDYRIDSANVEENWEKIAEGTVIEDNLTLDSTALTVIEKVCF